MDTHIYNVDINWNTERKGVMCSPELNMLAGKSGCIEVATPPEFPKGIPGIWSPEHLFTAAVSSCLMTTFLAIAENSKLEFVSFQCHSEGKLEILISINKSSIKIVNLPSWGFSVMFNLSFDKSLSRERRS